MWHLIWVCTVCLCSTNRMQGLYGLDILNIFSLYGPGLQILVFITFASIQASDKLAHPQVLPGPLLLAYTKYGP